MRVAGCAAPTSKTSPLRLRFDGVYAGGNYPYGCVENGNLREFYPKLWDLLLFYSDGTECLWLAGGVLFLHIHARFGLHSDGAIR